MAIGKVMARKGCIARWDAMIGKIGVVSHHVQSLWVALMLTVCASLYEKYNI